MEMLPMAFSKIATTWVWIDRTVVVTLKGGKVSTSHSFDGREGAGQAGAG